MVDRKYEVAAGIDPEGPARDGAREIQLREVTVHTSDKVIVESVFIPQLHGKCARRLG